MPFNWQQLFQMLQPDASSPEVFCKLVKRLLMRETLVQSQLTCAVRRQAGNVQGRWVPGQAAS